MMRRAPSLGRIPCKGGDAEMGTVWIFDDEEKKKKKFSYFQKEVK